VDSNPGFPHSKSLSTAQANAPALPATAREIHQIPAETPADNPLKSDAHRIDNRRDRLESPQASRTL